MKQKLSDYINELEKKKHEKEITKEFVSDVLTKIQFYQHERLVHLIVTFFLL